MSLDSDDSRALHGIWEELERIANALEKPTPIVVVAIDGLTALGPAARARMVSDVLGKACGGDKGEDHGH